jgi:hypothetical protein
VHNPPLTEAQLRAKAHPKGAVTSTCVPQGNGYRLAPDRDRHGGLDGDEEPALPAARATVAPVPVRAGRSWAGPAPPVISLSGRAMGISRRRRLLMTIISFVLPHCGNPFSGTKNGVFPVRWGKPPHPSLAWHASCVMFGSHRPCLCFPRLLGKTVWRAPVIIATFCAWAFCLSLGQGPPFFLEGFHRLSRYLLLPPCVSMSEFVPLSTYSLRMLPLGW